MASPPYRLLSLCCAVLLGAGVAVAHVDNPKAHPPVAPAAAPVWTVDKAASRLTFRVAAGEKSFDGVFKSWDAQIAFDPKNLKASRAMVTIGLASAITGDPMRDQQLPKAEGFDVARFPKATFETVSIASAAAGRYIANGDLTVHGVKRRIELPFTVAIAKDVARVDGAMTLQSADFGIARGGAAGEVTVKIKLTARKAH